MYLNVFYSNIYNLNIVSLILFKLNKTFKNVRERSKIKVLKGGYCIFWPSEEENLMKKTRN